MILFVRVVKSVAASCAGPDRYECGCLPLAPEGGGGGVLHPSRRSNNPLLCQQDTALTTAVRTSHDIFKSLMFTS